MSLSILLDTLRDAVPAVLQAATAIVTAASAITALTPTPRDDQFVGKVYQVIEALALNFGRAKDIAPNRRGGRLRPR